MIKVGKLVDLTGKKYGRLTVIERAVPTTHGDHAKWVCRCECGAVITAASNNLKRGNTTSCGCFQAECASQMGATNKKHGKSRTRLHKVWCGMIRRCYAPGTPYYKHYGGRGIAVCDEWRKDFQSFYDWAMANGYNPSAPRGECTIDRIDVNGNYEPANCRWVPMKVQTANRRLKGGNT